MPNSFNPLDPMNHSMYLEANYPMTINDAIASVPSYTSTPNGPKLRPQLTKDSWYYNKDNSDDGHISTFEKLKAFVKGGTYNMVKNMFCDNNGFSIGRTLLTAAGITAVALTGPIGMAVAGGVGLLAGLDNFCHSAKRASNAVTDQEAREAFEGFGESASTLGLSLFGGFKSIKAIKNNFALAKQNPTQNITLKDKLMEWDISKLFKKPQNTIPLPPNGNTNPPSGNTNPPGGNTNPPGGNTNPPGGNNGGGRAFEPNPNVTDIDATGYVPDWAPTGNIPKPYPTNVEYIPDWAPTGNIPKPVTPEYFSPYTPIDPTLVKPTPVVKPTAKPVDFVPDTAPIDPAVIKPTQPQPDFTYGQNNNHFFG